jgi:hypothetical protein
MIDQHEMAQEYIKCYSDKSRIYFIEHYLRTFNGTEGREVPFMLFPRQKVYCEALASNNKVVSIKHRQCGISTVSTAWITGNLVFATQEKPETVVCLANKKEQAIELLKKITDFLDQVPRWMWGDEYYSPDESSEKNKRDIYVKKSQSYAELFNGCKIYVRSSGPNATRGVTCSVVLLDEAGFIQDGVNVYASVVAATAAVKNAKIIMVSTPNGKDPLYYQTYKQAKEKKNGYVVVEFKWYQDLRYNRFLKWYKKNDNTGELEWKVEETIDEKGNIRYEPDKWRELERNGWKPTSPWYENMCQSMNNDPMKIAQELDVSFLGSSDNVVPAEVIERIRLRDVKDPLSDYGDKTEDLTWFWKAPIEGHRYILACDVSMGSSEDRTSIQVIDADGKDEYGMPYLEQIMEYNGRVLGDKLGDMLYKYGTLYNNAYIVVDATGGTGDACLLRLMNYWGYKNLYYDDNVMKQYMKITNKSNENFAERMPGFHFQGNRFSLLRNCANMISDGSFTVHSVRLCNELDTWIFKGEDGRMDHMAGSHDDNITCIAMALFIYKFSFQKLEATKSRDAAILNAYMRGGGYRPKENTIKEGEPIVSKATSLPFYSSRHVGTVKEMSDGRFGPYLWLRAGYK